MNKEARILVVEDEAPMRMVLRDCLERHGYRVLLAEDGACGLEKARQEKPDLILMDVMMPKLDGFSLCAELRKIGFNGSILLLTAKGRVEEKVMGLDRGADDYLIKPFSRDELLARVRSLLRRQQRQTQAVQKLILESVEIDFAQQRAWKNKMALELTAKEFAILKLLAESNGEVISRDRFLDVVWGYTAFPSTRTVDKHIASLRQKIEIDPENPRWIHTVHAVGYRFTPPGVSPTI